MILRTLRLHPFGGIQDRELNVTSGLNVIMGENDIGKSTTFRAIESILFITVALKLNTKEGRDFKECCFPIGGDFAQVTLDFEKNGKRFRLEKTWGPQPACRLTRPDGSVITALDRVEAELAQLFPAPEGTFRTVLLARQGQLVETLEHLSRSPDALATLGDLLRAALQQAGGVSVDRLKGLLKARIEDHFLNWDFYLKQPKQNRGIENPWSRQGRVLSLFYELERLKKTFIEVDSLEQKLAGTGRELGVKLASLEEINSFIRTHAPLIEADLQRERLEGQIARVEHSALDARNDYSTLIRAETEMVSFSPEIERLERELERLTTELKLAADRSNRKSLRLRYEQAQAKTQELAQAQKALSQLIPIRSEEVKTLRTAEQRVATLQAALLGGKLRVELVARQATRMMITQGITPESELGLTSGQRTELQSAGRIQIQTDSLSLSISSGEGDFEALKVKYEGALKWLADALTKFKVTTVEALSEGYETYRAIEQNVLQLDSTLKQHLGNETLEALAQRYGSLTSEDQSRAFDDIQADLSDRSRILGERRAGFKAARVLIEGLRRKYQMESSSELIAKMTGYEVDLVRIRSELKTLPPWPTEAIDRSSLRAKFQEFQTRAPEISEEVRRLSEEKGALKFPEASAQDLQRRCREVEARLVRELAIGKSLLRINQAINEIEADGNSIYSGLQADFERLIAQVTGGKYGSATLSGALPTHFLREDGIPIPYSMLSSGMKDGVALSLRIAMARYFVASSGGVILMDDPMVAMDEARRKEACRLLQAAGTDMQVLVFTCHEGHAKSLGGNLVSVGKV